MRRKITGARILLSKKFSGFASFSGDSKIFINISMTAHTVTED